MRPAVSPLLLEDLAPQLEAAGVPLSLMDALLREHEAHAARTDWHGQQARALVERTGARIAELRALLPQRSMVTIFSPTPRTKR